MADNPWAVVETKSDPWAVVPTPGYGEDMTKGAISGAVQGVIGLPGAAGDIQQLAKAGADKATEKGINPFGWLAGKFEDTKLGQFLKEESAKTIAKNPSLANSGDMMMLDTQLPTSHDVQSKVEEKTGPFYQAQTGPGKATQTMFQVAPSLLVGGEGLPGAIAKAAGAGAVSEGAGEAAHNLKGYLPAGAQPWAEPVARAVGAGAGVFAPATIRRGVTLSPMTDEQLATVNALRNTNPELVNASTAGQLTQSPRIMALEGRSAVNADVPQRQAEGYTQSVMRQAGAPGHMFDTPGLQAARGVGGDIDTLQNAHSMTPSEFQLLNRGVENERRDLFRSIGNSDNFNNVRDQIRGGPTGGSPQPLNMTGERYGALKQVVQNASEAAPTTHEQMALANVRQRMKDAFQNSMPPEEAARLRGMDQQYSNFKTIENIPREAGGNTVTPQQVHSKARVGGDLERHADQATSVMTPLPPRDDRVSDITSLIGSLAGAATHGGAGYLAGGAPIALAGMGEGALTGLFTTPHYVNAAKDIAARFASSNAGQAYLGNQFWRPGAATSSDRATLLRLLMSPPETGLLNGPHQ